MSAMNPTQPLPAEPSRVAPRHNVIVRVKANCGCGACFQTIQEGADHGYATGHTLHITGEIRAY